MMKNNIESLLAQYEAEQIEIENSGIPRWLHS